MHLSCSSALCAETVMLSNSSRSSGSASLFSSGISSSDSQTDDSPPHSPLSQQRKPSADVVQAESCTTPRFDYENINNPRQQSCKKTPGLLDLFGASDDGGYDSERETCETSNPWISRVLRSARKTKLMPRTRGLRVVSLTVPEDSLREDTNGSLVCPPKPRILPTVNLDSPSPILLSSPAQPNLRQPQLEVNRTVDDPVSKCYALQPPLENILLTDLGGYYETDVTTPVAISSAPRTRKSSGIGLGLPSVLCRSASAAENQDSLSSSRREDTKQRSKHHTPSLTRRTPGQPLNQTAGVGIISGTQRFFRTYQFPKRRLYDIPEHLPPKFSAKTFAFGRPSPRSASGIPPAAFSDFVRTKHVHPPLLNACKRPLLWLNMTSPGITHSDKEQKLDSVTQHRVDSSQLVALF